RHHRLFGAGVEDELGGAAAVYLDGDQDLLASDADRHGPGPLPADDLDGGPPLERVQEADLGAGPHRLLAAIAIRQQVEVIGEGGRGLVVAVLPLVDDAGGVGELRIPRRQAYD